jgi:DNA-binding response OmpR family regulator
MRRFVTAVRKPKYRALVTDINLAGGTDGWEVARAAREVDPEFPVVYMTGAAADEWAVQGVPKSVLLAKPFAPAQLITAISNLLNTGGHRLRHELAEIVWLKAAAAIILSVWNAEAVQGAPFSRQERDQ